MMLCYMLKLAIVCVLLLGIAQSYPFRLCRQNLIVKTRSFPKLSCKISNGDDIVASGNMEDADDSNQNNVMDTIVEIPTSYSLVTAIDSAVTTTFGVIDKATSPLTQSIAMSTDASVTTEPSATKSATVISPEDFHVVSRVDSKDEIRHLEMYLKRIKGGMISILIMTVIGTDYHHKHGDINSHCNNLMIMRGSDCHNDIIDIKFDNDDYYNIHSNDVLVLMIPK